MLGCRSRLRFPIAMRRSVVRQRDRVDRFRDDLLRSSINPRRKSRLTDTWAAGGRFMRTSIAIGAIFVTALLDAVITRAAQAPAVLPVDQTVLREYASVYQWEP